MCRLSARKERKRVTGIEPVSLGRLRSYHYTTPALVHLNHPERVASASARVHYDGPSDRCLRLTPSAALHDGLTPQADGLPWPWRRRHRPGRYAARFLSLPFFTCAAGPFAFIAGSLLTVIKVRDALNDPLIGWLSDYTSSRWGPRLP